MNYEDGKIKIDGILDTYKGNFTINILDIIGELSDEQKLELMGDGGFWSFITGAMAEKIISEFSRDNYMEEYTKLRGLILNSEAMPLVIREWAISLIESRENAKEREQYWDRAYWSLYHWARETLVRNDRDYSYFNPPKLPDRYYDHKYSEELMKEVETKIQEWKSLFPDKVEEGK